MIINERFYQFFIPDPLSYPSFPFEEKKKKKDHQGDTCKKPDHFFVFKTEHRIVPSTCNKSTNYIGNCRQAYILPLKKPSCVKISLSIFIRTVHMSKLRSGDSIFSTKKYGWLFSSIQPTTQPIE